jgi:hypothetical protein
LLPEGCSAGHPFSLAPVYSNRTQFIDVGMGAKEEGKQNIKRNPASLSEGTACNSAIQRRRKEDGELQASLGYIGNLVSGGKKKH